MIIAKYPINCFTQSTRELPVDAKILKAAYTAEGVLVLYAQSSKKEMVERTFKPVNSGREFPDNSRVRFDYIDTVQCEGAEECHVLERIDLREKDDKNKA
jgi:hypothetical protein